jgi:hypothetical protein
MRQCELEHHDSVKLDDVLRKHKSSKPTPEYHICIRPPLSFVERQKPWLMMNENKKKKETLMMNENKKKKETLIMMMMMMMMMMMTKMLMKRMMATSFTQ